VKRVLVGVLGAFVLHAWWLNCVAEDAYITYRFARNLAEGHGFVWNVGEGPVEGFTNFLWVLLSAAAYRLRLDLPLFAQLLGTIAGVITLIYAWRFSTEVLRHHGPVALFTTALLAAAGPLATWASSGMETVLFTMWVTLAVFYASRFPPCRSTSNTVAAAVCLLLATLTRPEGFGIFVIILVVEGAWRAAAPDARRLRESALLAGIYLPVFLAYFAWRFHTFGYPLPNTFYAKTGGGLEQLHRGIIYLGYFALHFLTPCVPWAVLCAWRLAGDRDGGPERQTRTSADADERRRGLWIAGAVVAGYLADVALVGGDYMAMYRFVVPVLPLIAALFGDVVEGAVQGMPLPPPRRALLALFALVSIGGVLLQSTRYETAIFAPTPRMHGTYRGVNIERWHVNRFHVIGEFFDSQARRADDSVLTWDIGVVGYVTRLKIYDALGMVDPVIAHTHMDIPLGSGMAGHEKQDLGYSYSRRPTFVMYTVQLRPQPAPWPAYPPDLARRVEAEYQLKSVWVIDSWNREQGYFTYLERRR
jgi:arabinofuranosyltransferase